MVQIDYMEKPFRCCAGCNKCKLNNFWNKQYSQPNKDLDIIKSIRKRAKTTGLPKLEPLPPVTEFEKKR